MDSLALLVVVIIAVIILVFISIGFGYFLGSRGKDSSSVPEFESGLSSLSDAR